LPVSALYFSWYTPDSLTYIFHLRKDVRYHDLTIKVSTEEQARLIGAALQDQWEEIGVDLEVRSLELATLFADLTKGNFQLSYLKWLGANNDPDGILSPTGD